MKFRSGAEEVEQFTGLIKQGKITEDELTVEWKRLRSALHGLIEQGSVDQREYDSTHGAALEDELSRLLH